MLTCCPSHGAFEASTLITVYLLPFYPLTLFKYVLSILYPSNLSIPVLLIHILFIPGLPIHILPT